MNRLLSLTLCAALAAGLWPDPAAAARIVTPSAPAAGAIVAPVVPVSPSLWAPGLSLSGTGALPTLSPGLSVTPLPTAAATHIPAAAAEAAAAQPSITPSAQTPIFATAGRDEARPMGADIVHRTVTEAKAPAEALEAAPGRTPSALAATVKTVRAMATGPSAEAKAGGLFDNAEVRSGAAAPSAVKAPAILTRPLVGGLRLAKKAVAVSPLGRLLPAETAQRWGRAPPLAAVSTPFSNDAFGGPQPLKASPAEGGRLRRWAHRLGRDTAYGLKWGVSLFGLASLLEITVKPLAALSQWQLWVPQPMLKAFGRVELLASMGPGDISDAVADGPLGFFTTTLPAAVFHEELVYRVLGFGITFLLLAAVRPAASRLSKFLDDVPDLFKLRSAAQWALAKLGGLSGRAFGIAAALSAASFAAAHFAAWGISPFTFALHLTLGAALAWVAYRSRGVTAPFMAHFSYNALAIASGTLAPLLLLPQTAGMVATVAGIASAAWAYYQWRSWKKDKAAAEAEARGLTAPVNVSWLTRTRRWLTAALIPVILLGAFTVMSPAPMTPVTPLPTPAVAVAHPGARAAVTPARGAPPATMNAEQLVKAVKPSVVMVLTPTGSGSGFIISADGLLVTNSHVVGRGEHVEDPLANAYHKFVKIRFANGREVPGKVVGYHAAKDIALVQLPPNPFGWPSVPLADTGALSEGVEVVAMGYPRALPFSVSRGIVSGKDFRSNGWVRYIQHDASVNPGNSGGPLFNMQGEVIGINSMIITESGGFDGISYAINSADLQKALDQYAKVGNISAPWLGAVFAPSQAASEFGAPVEAVRPGSPAAAAGLRAGDVVIGLDGASVAGDDAAETFKAVMHGIRAKAPGDPLQLQVYRAGAVVELTVTLGHR